MNYYFILYTLSIFFSIYGGISVFQKYKNPSGFFFLLFGISASIWGVLYFLFLGGNLGYDITLIISKLAFCISLLGMYTFLFFIYFFDYKKRKIFSKPVIIIVTIYTIIFCLSVFSELVISGLYIGTDGVYRENYGILYPFYVIGYLFFIPLVLYFIRKQLQKQNYINQLRLKHILYGVLVFIGSGLILQVILPLYGIWIFEKEIIIFFLFFIGSIVYTINRYYFSDIGYGIGKFFIAGISAILAFMTSYFLNNIIFLKINNGYWGSIELNSIWVYLFNIAFFIFFYHILRKVFLGHSLKTELENNIAKTQQHIAYITNIKDLNDSLKKEMNRIFKTNFCQIISFEAQEKNEIQKFFEHDTTRNIFINDIVFLEENKQKFSQDKIKSILPKDAFLVFPIFNNQGENIAIFCIGKKGLGDFYHLHEIKLLLKMCLFLASHLRYIKTYEQLQDFNVKLDKKVDEKTIEYNNLINKQKEFISLISHEIKSPLGAAIFQSDSILDDLLVGNLSPEELRNEVEILNNILIRIGELTTKLFTVQYYDTHNVTLYKEPIAVKKLLLQEIDIFSHTNPHIDFSYDIDDTIGFINIDKIQFLQVIQNIIGNAIKFVPSTGGKIFLQAYKKENKLHICIEDNGNGFEGIDIENIFDKYSTSGGNNIGLGMGLYLCKKIISMHSGEITSGVSCDMQGAKFCFYIPID